MKQSSPTVTQNNSLPTLMLISLQSRVSQVWSRFTLSLNTLFLKMYRSSFLTKDKGHLALRVKMALMVVLGLPVLLALLGLLALLALLALKVFLELLVLLALMVLTGWTGQLAHKVFKAYQALKARKGQPATEVCKDYQAIRAQQAHRD